MKLHKNKQLLADAIRVTSELINIAPEFAEKDYWICHILQHLSSHPNTDLSSSSSHPSLHLLFHPFFVVFANRFPLKCPAVHDYKSQR